MAAAKPKTSTKTYGATMKVAGLVNVEIQAESMEKALEALRTWKVPDVAAADEWYEHEDLQVTSLWEND